MPVSKDPFLTISDIEEHLKLSKKAVLALIRGGLKAYRFGERRAWRVRQSDFDAFVESRRVKGTTAPEQTKNIAEQGTTTPPADPEEAHAEVQL